ncbi:MAG: hypothetical protein MUO31_01265 [Thermodesulfovibrionales bacterium]|nr:hypothetical protein [Thermodesulfovibrionales bacterium]
MPEQKRVHLQHSYFIVGERPFCLWDDNIKKITLEFLDGLNPQFFSYIANSLENKSDDENNSDSQQSALLIRMIYSIALESFFALLASAIQSPYCVPAWINLYKPFELKNIIEKIHNEKPILTCLNAETLSWSSISILLLSCLVLEDKVKESEIKTGFAQLWTSFASEYLETGFSDEYNSIKHGLRVHPGSHKVFMGIQNKIGEPVPIDKLELISKSDFGTSFLKSEAIGENKHHQRLKRFRRNWSPIEMAKKLILLQMSIANIQSSLRILNGVPSDKVQFEWPEDFVNPEDSVSRTSTIGLTSTSGPNMVIKPENIIQYSKDDILKHYKLKKLS